ncbi:MAG: ribonuclease E/G, partial [Cryobacterium sp.]|nr:ribonuclease E/G [Cryobacterium sp.]
GGYLTAVAPDLADRVIRYPGQGDPFDEYRITEQIEKALDRKVWLPSGGSLVIDRTEAMTVVDVNTGKFVGSGGNLEETVTKNNLEAAEEIVRQLRLRDIGGIIVVDFIDMVLESNRDLVLRRLVECLSRDRTKHQVAEVTSLGLIQMTRKKLGLGLLESFSEPCEVCAGRGIIVHHDPVTKHRQSPQPEPKRAQRKGGQSAQKAAPGANGSNGGTHAITDDVKNALAKIAASTITPVVELAEQAIKAADQATVETAQGAAGDSADSAAGASDAHNDDAVAILDIPVARSNRVSKKISAKDAEQLLDSVLDSLPASPIGDDGEPKAPTSGRARTSRRASSAGLAAKSKD